MGSIDSNRRALIRSLPLPVLTRSEAQAMCRPVHQVRHKCVDDGWENFLRI